MEENYFLSKFFHIYYFIASYCKKFITMQLFLGCYSYLFIYVLKSLKHNNIAFLNFELQSQFSTVGFNNINENNLIK